MPTIREKWNFRVKSNRVESSSSSPVRSKKKVESSPSIKSNKLIKLELTSSSSPVRINLKSSDKKRVESSSSSRILLKTKSSKQVESSSPVISKKRVESSSSVTIKSKKNNKKDESNSPVKINKKKVESSSNSSIKLIKSSKKKFSSSSSIKEKKVEDLLIKCEGHYLDIEDDLKEISEVKTIQKIMSMTDYTKDFPNVQKYISKGFERPLSKLFKFKLFNICSQLLFIKNSQLNYKIIWITSNTSNIPTGGIDKRKEGGQLQTLKISWDSTGKAIIEDISAKNAPIPDLQIGSKIYTGYSVAMILGLALLTKLGFKEVHISDGSFVWSSCDWSNERETVPLFELRRFSCEDSIYARFGFILLNDVPNDLCKVSIGRILDDYTERINILRLDIKNTNIPKKRYSKDKAEEWRTNIANAISLLDLLSEEPRDMTIGEWLKSFKVGEERNCRFLMLWALSGKIFGAEFEYKGKIIPKTELFRLARQLYVVGPMVNPDVSKTYQDILVEAGVQSFPIREIWDLQRLIVNQNS